MLPGPLFYLSSALKRSSVIIRADDEEQPTKRARDGACAASGTPQSNVPESGEDFEMEMENDESQDDESETSSLGVNPKSQFGKIADGGKKVLFINRAINTIKFPANLYFPLID